MMRAQLPEAERDGGVSFAGPPELVVDLVRGTVRNVVAAFGEFVHGKAAGDPAWHGHVRVMNDAATAWIQTFLDCEAVVLFSFDPEATGPVR